MLPARGSFSKIVQWNSQKRRRKRKLKSKENIVLVTRFPLKQSFIHAHTPTGAHLSRVRPDDKLIVPYSWNLFAPTLNRSPTGDPVHISPQTCHTSPSASRRLEPTWDPPQIEINGSHSRRTHREQSKYFPAVCTGSSAGLAAITVNCERAKINL